MLILQNCRMLCTPKTGSSWSSAAVLRASEHAKPFGEARGRYYHAELRGRFSQLSHMPAMAFVRHPLTWYPSYWNHRIRVGWHQDHNIDRECASDDFQLFVSSVVTKFPGWLTTYLQRWIGTAERPAEFVGRWENLEDDLQRGLKFFGESFDEERLVSTPTENPGDYSKYPATWTESLKERVCESESELIDRYYRPSC